MTLSWGKLLTRVSLSSSYSYKTGNTFALKSMTDVILYFKELVRMTGTCPLALLLLIPQIPLSHHSWASSIKLLNLTRSCSYIRQPLVNFDHSCNSNYVHRNSSRATVKVSLSFFLLSEKNSRIINFA